MNGGTAAARLATLKIWQSSCIAGVLTATSLAAIGGAEDGAFAIDERRHLARVIPFPRLFDLDDIGAEVREQHSRGGAGEQTRQVEYRDSIERPHLPVPL